MGLYIYIYINLYFCITIRVLPKTWGWAHISRQMERIWLWVKSLGPYLIYRSVGALKVVAGSHGIASHWDWRIIKCSWTTITKGDVDRILGKRTTGSSARHILGQGTWSNGQHVPMAMVNSTPDDVYSWPWSICPFCFRIPMGMNMTHDIPWPKSMPQIYSVVSPWEWTEKFGVWQFWT